MDAQSELRKVGRAILAIGAVLATALVGGFAADIARSAEPGDRVGYSFYCASAAPLSSILKLRPDRALIMNNCRWVQRGLPYVAGFPAVLIEVIETGELMGRRMDIWRARDDTPASSEEVFILVPVQPAPRASDAAWQVMVLDCRDRRLWCA